MKNVLPASFGGVTVNFALPSTGVSKVMSILSDENVDGLRADAPSMHLPQLESCTIS